MQNAKWRDGGCGGYIKFGGFRCHPSQALLQGEGLRAARCTASANGVRNLIPYSSRATARVAPPALWCPCLKPGGRVRTPVPTADIEALPSSVGAGHRPARRLHSSCHLPGSAWHRNSDSHGVKKTGKNEKNAWQLFALNSYIIPLSRKRRQIL